jgi:hypothetical protein
LLWSYNTVFGIVLYLILLTCGVIILYHKFFVVVCNL